MRGKSGGRLAALWAGLCLVAAGCDCGDTRTVKWEPENDLSVSVRRAVSCGGEDVELSPLVYGGKAPYAFSWEPADGLTDPAARNPRAKGDRERTYTLTVTDAQGLTAVLSVPLERRAPPDVRLGFKSGAAKVCAGTKVQLVATAVAGDGKPVDAFSWDLGDGTPALVQKGPTLAAFVPQDGQRVRLTVTDDAGCSAQVEQVLAVRRLPTPGLAFVEGAVAICAGDGAALDASSSVDADGQPVASFAWDLDGDASTVESTAPLSGTFVPRTAPARVTVKDAFGCEAVATQAFDVGALPTPRIAFAEGAAAVCEGASVRLDASGSTDALGDAPVKFEWDLDGVPATVESTDASPPAFALNAARDVTLTVTDVRGCRASGTESLLARALPTARIAITQGRANACAGDELVLSAEGSTDAAGNPVAAYLWDLDGDGRPEASGAVAPPIRPRAAQTASVVVADSFGCEAVATQRLEPRALPTAAIAFTRGDERVCAGELVALDASASRDAQGRPVASYAWDLDGDGAADSTALATSDFAPSGAPVRLTVKDAQGCANTITQAVAVDARPTAVIRFVQGGAQVCEGAGLLVDAMGSTAPAGQEITAYAWDVDGDTQSIESTRAQPPAFTLGQTTDLRLTVTAANGCSHSAVSRVEVRGAPRAVLEFTEGRANACEGGRVALSASGSTDVFGAAITKFEWDVDDDGDVDASGAALAPFVPRAQTVKVTVHDAKGCTATATQALAPRALPVANIAFAQGEASVCGGALVTLDGAGSRDADGRPVASYAWDTDGDAATVESRSPGTEPFVPSGAVSLTVVDAQGCRGTATQTLSEAPNPTPVIRFARGGALVCAGGDVALDASASTDSLGQPVARLEWDLDGVASTVESTAARPPAFLPTGPRTVTLRVWDARGCSGSVSQAIAVRALPQARVSFATGRADACRGDAVAFTSSGSIDADGNAPAAWAWDYETDGHVDATTPTTPAFVPAGAQQVKLVVTDAKGCSAAAMQAIAPRAPPVPAIRFVGGSGAVCSGATVALDASASKDADGAPVAAFAWDLDGVASSVESTVATPPGYAPTGAPARLTITDRLGCRASATQAIDVFPRPTARIRFTSGAPAVCEGDAVGVDGSGSTDASGGPVARYAWDFDGDAATVESTLPAPGRFAAKGQVQPRLTVWDARGCSADAVELVTARPLPTPQLAFTTGRADVCAGDAVAFSAAGSRDADGFAVTGYAWDLDGVAATTEWTSSTTPAFRPTASVPVTVQVTDAFGCRAKASQALAPRALPKAAIAFLKGRPQVCEGEPVKLSGAASRDADGQPVASFTWDLETDGVPDATTPDSPETAPRGPRNATLTVTDAKGCRASATQPITTRALPVPRIAFTSGQSLVCRGGLVSLDASASRDADGNALAAFAWDLDANGTTDRTAATTGAFAPTSSASVSLKVTDLQGCMGTATQDLNVRAPPSTVITFAKGGAEACGGDAIALSGTSSRDADGHLVASYAWDLDGVPATVESTSGTTPDLTPAATITATLVTRDAFGCTSGSSQLVTVRARPTAAITFLQGAASACGDSTVQLSGGASRDADGVAPASYAWDVDSDGTWDGLGVASPAFTASGARTATLIVTDARGCRATATQAITARAPPVPRIAFTTGTSLVCRGAQVALDAAASRDADGNAVSAFAWDLDGNGTIDRTSSSTGTFAPTASSPVSLLVTDAKGCTASTSQALTVRAPPATAITFAKGAATACGGSAVALSGTGSRDADGNPVANYRWDLDGNRSTAESTSATTPDFTPAGNLTATLVTTDVFGCEGEASQPISVRAIPTAAIAFLQGSSNVCPGSPVQLSAAGSRDADGAAPAAFAWDLESDGTIDAMSAASPAFTPTTARTATLTVTDSKGCRASATQAIGLRAPPVPRIAIASGAAQVCRGGQVSLDGSGSRDAAGAAVAGYAWDLDGDGATDRTSASTGSFAPASTGPVSLKVTDAQGCTASATQPLTVRANPTARIAFSSGSADVCAGSNVSLSGSASRDADGNSVASYAWDLDGTRATTEWFTASTPPFSPVTTTTTTLVVTDAFGCTGEATQLLTERPLPVANAGADVAACRGTPVQLGSAAQAGVTYAWTPASGLDTPNASYARATPSSTTAYTLTARSAYGCVASDSVQVTVHQPPVADAGPDRQVSQGTSVRLLGAASGGTPGYTYAWTPPLALSDPAIAQPNASPTSNTAYTLKVTDSLGCFASDTVAVTALPSLVVNADPDVTYCASGTTPLTLSSGATGGVPPLSYAWTASPACGGCIASPTSASTVVTPAGATTFTITVTDAAGTVVSDSVVVTPGELPGVDAGPDRRLRTGEWTLLGTPAQPGLAYQWTCNRPGCGLTDPTSAQTYAAPRGTTVYTLTVTNGGNCVTKDTVLVAMEARLLAAMPSEGMDPWPRDAPLWVVFDTDIDAASLLGNVYLLDPVDGRRIWIRIEYDATNRMLVVHPLDSCGAGCVSGEKAYRNNAQYLLVLKGGPGGVMTAGALPEPLYNDLTLEFVASSMGDGNSPAILHRRPAMGATNVPRDTQVVIKFDEHVDPRTVSRSTIWIEGVPGSVEYDIRTKQVFVRPASALAPNTTYTVRVDGVVDARSSPTRVNALVTSWTFTTGFAFDTTPPSVVSFSPSDGTLGHDPGTALTVTFSEPMDYWTVGMARLVDDASHYPVVHDVLYDDQTLTAKIMPKGFLEPSRAYRIEVSDVYDWGANELPTVARSRFTTKGARLYQTFEAGTPGWSLDTPWGLDYQAAYVDYYGLSDSPGGNYAANAWTSARTPLIDVSGLGAVSLSFFGRQTLGSTDRMFVEYSHDGSTWTTAGSQAGCTGWRRWDYSLPTGGRSQMYVRFRLAADSAVNLDGWFIDEVLLR